MVAWWADDWADSLVALWANRWVGHSADRWVSQKAERKAAHWAGLRGECSVVLMDHYLVASKVVHWAD